MKRYDLISYERIEGRDFTLIPVMVDGKWGLINDETHEEVAIPNYDTIPTLINKKYIKCYFAGKCGVVDFNGESQIVCDYDDVEIIEKNVFIVKKDNKYGLIYIDVFHGKAEKICDIISDEITLISDFMKPFYMVVKDGKYGLIDSKGNIRLDTEYASISHSQQYYLNLQDNNGNVMLYSISRNCILTKKYQRIRNFSEYLAAVQNEKGLWGFIDSDGSEIVKCKYHDVRDFHNGFAVVKIDDKFGYINAKGDEVSKIIYSYAKQVNERGIASVMIATKDPTNTNKTISSKGTIHLK